MVPTFDNGSGGDGGGDRGGDGSMAAAEAHHQAIRRFRALDPKELRDAACGICILCRMPRCERCFACVTARGRSEEWGGGCLRKICCNVPIELKLQHAVGLGFPRGWMFSFDDPQKLGLVWSTKRVLSLAGLRIVSPQGKLFHSLESALAYFPHCSACGVTDIVEKFLVHVGSSRFVSIPGHFLVGKNYSAEFTNKWGYNTVLFGKLVACMRLSGTNGDGQSFFIVEYDRDALSAAKSAGTGDAWPIQLIGPEAAWGGCISFERRIHCQRDSLSAIQNIDQATSVETWVAPDVRTEDLVEQPNGSVLPQLTIFARGYKFAFRAGKSNYGSKQQFGVFVSCMPMQEGAGRELNLKPGELIDLGIFSPLRKEDEKTLPSFIIKNYIHSLKVGRWGVISGRDDVVYDLTDDRTGRLHDTASKRVLSYFRKCGRSECSVIHMRPDPNGHAHFLFGVRYEGNWSEYEGGMQQLIPLFSGREVEVTISRRHGLGNKISAGSKYLQSIGMFQLEDILACNSQLSKIFDSEISDDYSSHLIDRSRQVVECLEERTQKLLQIFVDAKSHEGESDGIINDGGAGGLNVILALNSALEYLRGWQERWKDK